MTYPRETSRQATSSYSAETTGDSSEGATQVAANKAITLDAWEGVWRVSTLMRGTSTIATSEDVWRIPTLALSSAIESCIREVPILKRSKLL